MSLLVLTTLDITALGEFWKTLLLVKSLYTFNKLVPYCQGPNSHNRSAHKFTKQIFLLNINLPNGISCLTVSWNGTRLLSLYVILYAQDLSKLAIWNVCTIKWDDKMSGSRQRSGEKCNGSWSDKLGNISCRASWIVCEIEKVWLGYFEPIYAMVSQTIERSFSMCTCLLIIMPAC